jgi:hypothetical protein
VHDVVCLANAEHNGDRYLVFCVEDSTHTVVGVQGSTPRRKQADVVNILRQVPFSRDRRPEVSLHTIEFPEG